MQLSQQEPLDVRNMDMDTTEGEVQKALAETTGVPVEALKVKAMRPMYGGTQMAIVTIPRMNALHIIKNGKVRIGWVIARVQEKISIPRCFRYSAFGHLPHNCDKGNNATKPFFLCRATDHLAATCSSEPVCTQCKAMGVDHRHRSGSANALP